MGKFGNKRKRRNCCLMNWFNWIASLSLVVLFCGSVEAFTIVNERNLGIRWDNTFRYNFGVRMRSPQGCMLNSPNYDDGDRNFGKANDIVTNRLDILSELDFVFKKNFGVRVSGAFWYDQRYDDSLHNDSIATSNHLENGVPAFGLSDQAKRWYKGPDGEVLDAFAFANFDLGNIPITMKIGRHTVYWGESFLLQGGIQGISYSQMPIDAAKGLAVPGSELKELYRPLANVSMQAQLTNTISLAGQYFFQWESYRFPEAGTFLGSMDMVLNGGEILYLAPGYFVTKGDSAEPDGTKNWGVALRWNSRMLGGALGLYYRRFADMIPQVGIAGSMMDIPGVGNTFIPNQYFFGYGGDIDLYGLSLSTKFQGVSIGAELSYRRDMPLCSDPFIVIDGLMPKPGKGETYGARGNTFHGLINFMGMINNMPMFDQAVYIVEFAWSHWSHVTSGSQYFQGNDIFAGINKVTEHAVNAAVMFTPTWFQVFSGIDISMPMSYGRGLDGNSAVGSGFGINENAGNWSVGVAFDVNQKYNFAVSYVGYFGDVAIDSAGGISSNNGGTALLKDRDMLTFTFKTTF